MLVPNTSPGVSFLCLKEHSPGKRIEKPDWHQSECRSRTRTARGIVQSTNYRAIITPTSDNGRTFLVENPFTGSLDDGGCLGFIVKEILSPLDVLFTHQTDQM